MARLVALAAQASECAAEVTVLSDCPFRDFVLLGLYCVLFLLAGFSKWLKCKLTLASAMAPSTLDSGLRRLTTEAHFQNHDLFVQGLLRVRALANGEQTGCWKSLFLYGDPESWDPSKQAQIQFSTRSSTYGYKHIQWTVTRDTESVRLRLKHNYLLCLMILNKP